MPGTKKALYERWLERFVQEGKMLARVSHPNVVRVKDLFEERGTAYLVMELIQGRNLKQEQETLAGRRFPDETVRLIGEQLVEALGFLHSQEIVHLDIKPENVLLTPEGKAVLVDFGSARQGLDSQATRAFTAEYVAPEVLAGGDVGPGSDIFELGMLFHEMLTGALPPSGLSRLLRDTWKPSLVHEPWNCLVESALRVRREDRPGDIKQWWQEVSRRLIACVCPLCETRIKALNSGGIACSSCDWKFEINADGEVVGGLPPHLSCPGCLEEFTHPEYGEVECPECGWEFEVNEDGKLISGRPVECNCPKCSTRLRVREAGDVGCTKCDWKFKIDSLGHVIAGGLKRCPCPRCGRLQGASAGAVTTCSECHWVFDVEDFGGVISSLPKREMVRYRGHSEAVNCLAYSVDRLRFASGSDDHTVRIWDARLGNEVRLLSGHTLPVNSVTFSPDGRFILSSGDDRVSRLWDISSGLEARHFEGHNSVVANAIFSHDGSLIFSGGYEGVIRRWDVSSGAELGPIGDGLPFVTCLAIVQDGDRLISGHRDGTVRIWDAKSATELRKFRIHSSNVNSVIPVSGSSYVISCGSDQVIKLWYLRDGSEIRRFLGHRKGVNCLSLSPSQRRLISGCAEGIFKVWDLQNGREIYSGKSLEGPILSVLYDSRTAIVASANGHLCSFG